MTALVTLLRRIRLATAAAVVAANAVQGFSGYVLPVDPADVAPRLARVALATPSAFTRDQALAALTRSIAAHFSLEGELQLELTRPWSAPLQLAAGWELTVLEYPSASSSNMLVRCRLLGDGKPVSDPTFMVRAQLWRDAWTTRQPLVTGSAFDPAMLEARRVDLLRDRDAVPAAVGDRNYIFARAVPAGRLLTWHDIARRPLVKKGDMVDVSAADGALVVTMKALAMENGAQGDTVTIRNPVSRKDFAATVVDENRVQVRF